MANLTVPLTSLEIAIYYDIYHQIIRDVANFIKVDEKTITVMYNSMDISKTDMKSNARLETENNTPTTVSKRRLLVRVNDDFDEEAIGSSTVNRKDNYPIFLDEQIGVYISPVYFNNEITFEFTYTSSSREEIGQIRNRLRSNLTQTQNLLNHQVPYTIILPEFLDIFIRDIHALKTRLSGEDLLTYFRKHNGNKIYSVTDMSNRSNAQLAIREIQHEVLGYLEMTTKPSETDSNNEDNNYSISFSYQVAIEIPKELSFNFPIAICNDLMPDDYLIAIQRFNNDFAKDARVKMRSIGISNTQINAFASQSNSEWIYDMRYPINIPDFDGHYDFNRVTGYGALATILCQIDEDDKKTLLNLNELDDYYIPTKLMDYIKGKGRKRVCGMFESFFWFGLDQEGKHMNNDILEIDDDLNIKSLTELDLYKPARIILNICTDMTKLTEEAIREIDEDDELFLIFLTEYLEIKDVLLNTTTVSLEPRQNRLTSYLLRKLHQKNLARDYDFIREMITIVNRDIVACYELGKQLLNGFHKLYYDLSHNRVLYVDIIGMVTLIDKDVTDQELKEILIERKSKIDYENRYVSPSVDYRVTRASDAYSKLERHLARTVMTSVALAKHKEDN